jgi:hypothetical protein
MNQNEFAAKAFQLSLTAAGFAREVDGMDEAPAGMISKFSWYLLNSEESGPGVKVVRHAQRDWGPAQRDSLLRQAESHAQESKEAMTAVVGAYGDLSSPAVRVDCFYRGTQTSIAFPYTRRDGILEYQPTLDEQRALVQAAMQDWASKTIRRRIFGVF